LSLLDLVAWNLQDRAMKNHANQTGHPMPTPPPRNK